jgi:small conductance mechanosensitive channel
MDFMISTDQVMNFTVNVVAALVIAIGAMWFSGFVRRRIVKLGLKYKDLDDTLFTFLGSLARYAILAFAVIFILGKFGVQTTSLAAVVGAAGLAIGLALQGTLSNLAAGIMLVAFRPIKLGDFIEAGGHMGTVKDITLFNTELATLDNVQVIVPNGMIWNAAITNYSVYTTRRIQLMFGVSYGSDLKKAEEVIFATLAADDRVHSDPEHFVKVTTLGASSVDFMVRVWCDSSDFLALKSDLTRAVKEAFDAAGIDIPFPTTMVIRADG